MEEFNLIKKSKNKDSESQKKQGAYVEKAYVEKCISFLILPTDVDKGLSKKDARVAEHKMRLEAWQKHEMLRKSVEACGSSNRATKYCKSSNLNDDEEDHDDGDVDGKLEFDYELKIPLYYKHS